MITRSITMQKYDHPVAVYESSPKNNQTKLNNSQLHQCRKLPKPPSANRTHSPKSQFSHNPKSVIRIYARLVFVSSRLGASLAKA